MSGAYFYLDLHWDGISTKFEPHHTVCFLQLPIPLERKDSLRLFLHSKTYKNFLVCLSSVTYLVCVDSYWDRDWEILHSKYLFIQIQSYLFRLVTKKESHTYEILYATDKIKGTDSRTVNLGWIPGNFGFFWFRIFAYSRFRQVCNKAYYSDISSKTVNHFHILTPYSKRPHSKRSQFCFNYADFDLLFLLRRHYLTGFMLLLNKIHYSQS